MGYLEPKILLRSQHFRLFHVLLCVQKLFRISKTKVTSSESSLQQFGTTTVLACTEDPNYIVEIYLIKWSVVQVLLALFPIADVNDSAFDFDKRCSSFSVFATPFSTNKIHVNVASIATSHYDLDLFIETIFYL